MQYSWVLYLEGTPLSLAMCSWYIDPAWCMTLHLFGGGWRGCRTAHWGVWEQDTFGAEVEDVGKTMVSGLKVSVEITVREVVARMEVVLELEVHKVWVEEVVVDVGVKGMNRGLMELLFKLCKAFLELVLERLETTSWFSGTGISLEIFGFFTSDFSAFSNLLFSFLSFDTSALWDLEFESTLSTLVSNLKISLSLDFRFLFRLPRSDLRESFSSSKF